MMLAIAAPACAEIELRFHSFNGSVLIGRYPHTFISMTGTLDATGEKIDENYGFSAQKVTPAILKGAVNHKIVIEPKKYVASTNVHFSVPISDEQYRRIIAEVAVWKNAPGKFYDLDKRNCIHFVGTIASIVGLKVEFPDEMLRQPKRWLNHITFLNPHLGARMVR